MAVERLPKLNFSVPFAMTSALPLNANEYFESYDAAVSAAATAEEAGSSNTQYYYGEPFLVVEDGKATMYQIQPDKTLKEVGSVPVGDDKTIEVVDGVVQIVGAGEATAGQQLRIGTDGNLEWFTPDTTTVEGLSATVAGHTEDISNLQANKADKATTLEGYGITDAMTSTQITEAIASAIAATGHASFEIADAIPTPETAEDHVLYLVKNTNTHYYDIYAKVSGEVVRLDDVSVDLSDYSTTEEMNEAISAAIAGVTTALGDKVDKVEGSRLMTDEEGTKLAGIEDGAQVNKIDAVSDEFQIDDVTKTLSIQSVEQSKVVGLPDALAQKVNVVDGKQLSTEDFTTELKTKLEGVADGAQANVIEKITIAGTETAISEKTVDIPAATQVALGMVKGSETENGVVVAGDGSMSVHNLNVNKLVQTEGEVLILDGGGATLV